jgi:hypothetical protein
MGVVVMAHLHLFVGGGFLALAGGGFLLVLVAGAR